MNDLLHLFILFLTILVGIVSIRAPIKIARVIVWWTKLATSASVSNPKTREAVYLMENDPNEYAQKFAFQLKHIERFGAVLILISLIGSCLIVFSK